MNNLIKNKKEFNLKSTLKEIGLFVVDILYNAIIIIILVVLIRTFLISPFRVVGSSMVDTLHDNNFILIDKLSYRLKEPKRGDPIVFRPPITNKYPPKFEKIIQIKQNGEGQLDLKHLKSTKDVTYCKNKIFDRLWFCQNAVRNDDLIFYHPVQKKDGDNSEIIWGNAFKKIISDQEVANKNLQIQGEPNQNYIIRIYDSVGPEYFVKRIIGVPGDTIKIENGRVYIKNNEGIFKEAKEKYLNQDNKNFTYLLQQEDSAEFKVPEGHYFTLGDNRRHSNDSRGWFSPITKERASYVPIENISGKVLVVLWPLKSIHFIPSVNPLLR